MHPGAPRPGQWGRVYLQYSWFEWLYQRSTEILCLPPHPYTDREKHQETFVQWRPICESGKVSAKPPGPGCVEQQHHCRSTVQCGHAKETWKSASAQPYLAINGCKTYVYEPVYRLLNLFSKVFLGFKKLTGLEIHLTSARWNDRREIWITGDEIWRTFSRNCA